MSGSGSGDTKSWARRTIWSWRKAVDARRGAASARFFDQAAGDFLAACRKRLAEDISDFGDLALARSNSGDPVGDFAAIDDRAAMVDRFDRVHCRSRSAARRFSW